MSIKNLFTLLVFGNAVFYLCAEFKEETIWQETFSIGMCGASKKQHLALLHTIVMFAWDFV